MVFVVVLFTALAGGGPCDKIRSHTDAFGDTTRGRVAYVGAGGYLAVSLVEAKGERTLQVMYVRRGKVDPAVAVGTLGEIKLEDGTVLSLMSSAEAPPVQNATTSTVFTQWQIPYLVDANALNKLAASPIVAVRTELAGAPASFEVPAKKSKKLLAAAACFASD